MLVNIASNSDIFPHNAYGICRAIKLEFPSAVICWYAQAKDTVVCPGYITPILCDAYPSLESLIAGPPSLTITSIGLDHPHLLAIVPHMHKINSGITAYAYGEDVLSIAKGPGKFAKNQIKRLEAMNIDLTQLSALKPWCKVISL